MDSKDSADAYIPVTEQVEQYSEEEVEKLIDLGRSFVLTERNGTSAYEDMREKMRLPEFDELETYQQAQLVFNSFKGFYESFFDDSVEFDNRTDWKHVEDLLQAAEALSGPVNRPDGDKYWEQTSLERPDTKAENPDEDEVVRQKQYSETNINSETAETTRKNMSVKVTEKESRDDSYFVKGVATFDGEELEFEGMLSGTEEEEEKRTFEDW